MSYHSPLGLNDGHQRYVIRQKAVSAALVAVSHRTETTYTEGRLRWDGIAHDRRAYRRESPHQADCSSLLGWCFWDATRAERLGDFVNGENWTGGYTGTMVNHGEDVTTVGLKPADAVFYGTNWARPAHTALYIGNGRVVSHGMQGDPRIYPVSLFGALPILRAKRYIR